MIGASRISFLAFSAKSGAPFMLTGLQIIKILNCKTLIPNFWCPGTSGVDAFAYDWRSDLNWLVPPVCLIPRVLKHLVNCRARGVLVVPKWESSLFWPMIIDLQSGVYRFFILEVVEYSKPANFFVPGSDSASIFAETPFVSDVLVM